LTIHPWPPRSPDLTAWDFFLWGYLKNKVYLTPLPTDLEELKTRIKYAVNTVTRDMTSNVWEKFEYRIDVCHEGLLYKLKIFLPAPYYLIIKSYLKNRTFMVRQFNYFSSYFCIQAGVPQGSDLSPDLCNIFTADIPNSTNTILATYTDDAAILSPRVIQFKPLFRYKTI